MKAVMIMFDSLNRRFLQPYGNNEIMTPNFQKLSEHTICFDQFYVGSMPCMPARREMHTGRYNFLHRGWGPLEPFDDSVPEILKNAGVHSHLVTDHKHYWRDGGSTYHNRYRSYEFIRGQEGDSWIGQVDKPKLTELIGESQERRNRKLVSRTQDLINRQYMDTKSEHMMVRTVNKGLEFMEMNREADQWFLQIECFDPHEPYYVPQKYLDQLSVTESFDGWPDYYIKTETDQKTTLIQNYYKALLLMCDDYLGKILNRFDEYDLWKDTMLIVCTDHGFLLGEHDWWGKSYMPVFNELANTPFFLWDPRLARKNEHYQGIAQLIDIPATLLDYFRILKPKDMRGTSLSQVIKTKTQARELALFGYFGCNVNLTDGRYVYMRSAQQRYGEGLFEYTLMPMRINRRFSPAELKDMTLHTPFSFTKGCPVLKITSQDFIAENMDRFGNRLYDLTVDPQQKNPLDNDVLEAHYANLMRERLLEEEADEEILNYYGLLKAVTPMSIRTEKETKKHRLNDVKLEIKFSDFATQEGFLSFMEWLPKDKHSATIDYFRKQGELTQTKLIQSIEEIVDSEYVPEVMYRVFLNMRID
jgi:arylsulfatase A-like enzyme